MQQVSQMLIEATSMVPWQMRAFVVAGGHGAELLIFSDNVSGFTAGIHLNISKQQVQDLAQRGHRSPERVEPPGCRKAHCQDCVLPSTPVIVRDLTQCHAVKASRVR
jgi:hypothetical protein